MSNIELKDLIELHLSSIREEIKSASELSEYKFDMIIKRQDETIEHQKTTNGRVTKLEVTAEDLKSRLKPVEWVGKNKKSLLVTIIAGWFLLDIVSKSVDWLDIINIIK